MWKMLLQQHSSEKQKYIVKGNDSTTNITISKCNGFSARYKATNIQQEIH